MIDTDEGKYKNLEESIDRLRENGFLKEDPSKIKIFWSTDPDWNQAGASSNLMKTVIINKRFDTKEIEDSILDLVVLKYVCYALSNFKNSKDEHAEKLEETIRSRIAVCKRLFTFINVYLTTIHLFCAYYYRH